MKIIDLRLELTSPFDRWDYFRGLGSISGKLARYTAWELEHSYYSPLLLDIELSWSRQQDHAGFEFGLGILGYGVHFRVYDTRHWNYEAQRYEVRDFSEYFDLKFKD